MTITIINKIKKNLLMINIIIIFFAILFFYLNKDRFDTYKTFIIYSFQERLMIDNNSETSLFNSGQIKFFLNDLDFNNKFYGIRDSHITDSVDNISINIEHKKEEIEFSFITKEKFLSLNFFANEKIEDKGTKNREMINNFIEETLNKFHIKLYKQVDQVVILRKEQLNDLLSLRKNNKEDKSDDLINIEISKALYNINELQKFSEIKNRLIIVNNYSNKFRRLHLNTKEYLLSFLILLLLVNFLIKNIDKILK